MGLGVHSGAPDVRIAHDDGIEPIPARRAVAGPIRKALSDASGRYGRMRSLCKAH